MRKRTFLTLADAEKIAAAAMPQTSASARVICMIALPFTRPPHALLVEPIVRHALEEDLGRAGDITSDLIVPPRRKASAKLVARKAGTIAGLDRGRMRLPPGRSDTEIRRSKLPDGSHRRRPARRSP